MAPCHDGCRNFSRLKSESDSEAFVAAVVVVAVVSGIVAVDVAETVELAAGTLVN